MAEEIQRPETINTPAPSQAAGPPPNGGPPAISAPIVEVSVVESLLQQLISIRRDAISVLRVTEDLLQLPPEKRALRTRAERRANTGDGAGSG